MSHGGQDNQKEVENGSLRGLISEHPLVGGGGRRIETIWSRFLTALVFCMGHLRVLSGHRPSRDAQRLRRRAFSTRVSAADVRLCRHA